MKGGTHVVPCAECWGKGSICIVEDEPDEICQECAGSGCERVDPKEYRKRKPTLMRPVWVGEMKWIQ
jgi:DnaJ-class molecular chaperone